MNESVNGGDPFRVHSNLMASVPRDKLWLHCDPNQSKVVTEDE